MGSGTASQWGSIERWSPALFLIGGGLMVCHATVLAVQAFSNLTAPPDVFGPTGHFVAALGLVGLYPVLADRAPTMAQVAGPVAVVTLVSWAVMTVTRLLVLTGLVTAVSDVLPSVFFVLVFATTILTYVLFGAASLRVEDSSQVVGLLVLAPGALILVALVASTIASVTALVGVVIAGGLALSMLGLGYVLRPWGRSADSATLAGEVTAW